MVRNWERHLRMNSPNEFIAFIHFDFFILFLAGAQVRVVLYLILGKSSPSTEKRNVGIDDSVYGVGGA
jgi:hypothetical protein